MSAPEQCPMCQGQGKKFATVGNWISEMIIRCPRCEGMGMIVPNDDLVKWKKK